VATVISAKSLKVIEKGIRAGKCLTLVPNRRGSIDILESSEFLSPQESEEFLKTLAQPTSGDWLERFIWEFADGSVKTFAAKVGYHPNRISVLKSSTIGLSMRLVRRIIKAYKLSEKEQAFWVKRWLNV
jgi:hypothetical protein